MGKVHFIYGPQGAGKSTYSKKLAEEQNAVHFSIDDWMWKLFGEDMPKSMNLKWIMERVERCESQIWETAQKICACDGTVILDLGFTKFASRKRFRDLAKELNIETQVHFIDAPHALRRERVLNRNIEKGETFSFEVTPGMFDFMETEYHSLSESELLGALVFDTGKNG